MADNALIVTVKPTKTVVSSVTIAPTTSISLGSLTNVDTSGADDGEVLLFDAANHAQTMEVPLWSGLHLHVQCVLQHSCNNSSQPATTGALQQLQLAMINNAISHAKGNVAQAAKALGISRATLYRKLSRKSSH